MLLAQASSEEHRARFDPRIWPSLLAAVDADANNMLDWRELLAFLGEVVEHITRDKQLDEMQEKQQQQQQSEAATTGHA